MTIRIEPDISSIDWGISSIPAWGEGGSDAATAAPARAPGGSEERGEEGGAAGGRGSRMSTVSIGIDSEDDLKSAGRRSSTMLGALAVVLAASIAGAILIILTLMQANGTSSDNLRADHDEQERMLVLAERVVTACSERRLDQDQSECLGLCHTDIMCCFQEGKYSCQDDESRRCPVYAGCEALVFPKAEEDYFPPKSKEEDAVETEASSEKLPAIGKEESQVDNKGSNF